MLTRSFSTIKVLLVMGRFEIFLRSSSKGNLGRVRQFEKAVLTPRLQRCLIAPWRLLMSERDDRLVRCFASVFPTLSEGEIRASNVIPLFDLDSLAGVTLVTLIDQEFDVN